MAVTDSPYARAFLSGIVTWLVPFIVSLFFYTENGLIIDIFLFKSVMIVTGSLTGALMMIWFFKHETGDYLRSGVLFGLFVLVINWILDIIVLCTILGENPVSWFTGVGIRYLIIPVMSITTGYIVDNTLNKTTS